MRRRVRTLLRNYLDQRVLFYMARNGQELQQINARTAQLQTELWSAIRAPAAAQPTHVMALAVSGMNDVLNSQGYTQAGYWNQIPTAAWGLMAAIAIGCNLLVGYGSRSVKAGSKLLPILPLIVSIAFMLIADIDSPRHGIIRVRPQNLISLAESLPTAQRNTINPMGQCLIGVMLSDSLIRSSHSSDVPKYHRFFGVLEYHPILRMPP